MRMDRNRLSGGGILRQPVASQCRVKVERFTLLVIVVGALVAVLLSAELPAQGAKPQKQATADVPQLTVIASKSIVVNTAEPIARVSVTDQVIADALVISPQQVLINGKSPGLVSLILWDRNGKTTSYDLVVESDISLLQRQLEEQFPTENINVSTAKGAIVLSGSASEPRVVEKAVEIAGAFAKQVVNMLLLPPPPDSEQILLQVKFADVDRVALQQMGVNLFSLGGLNTLAQTTTQQFQPSLNNLNLKATSPSAGPDSTASRR